MPIVFSQVVMDRLQRNSTRWIKEAHTDHIGGVHEYGPYTLPMNRVVGEEVIPVEPDLAGHAALLEARLIDQELEDNLAEALNADV